MQHRSVL